MDHLMTRGRASQLDDALAGPAAGAPPAVSDELALAVRLRDAGAATALTPTPEFREALRTRLMAVAAVQGIGDTATAPAPARSAVSWRQRAVTVGAGVLATVVAASGVAVASSRSLPGDPFYGVKRTTEALQLRAADGDHDEGVRHLQFAATRLREVHAMVLGRDAEAGAVPSGALDGDVEADVRDALADMDTDTRTGRRLLTGAFRTSRATAPLQELTRFAERQQAALRTVMPALSGTALAQAQGSLTLVEDVRAEADGLLMLVDCTAACDPAQVAPAPGQPGSPAAPCGCPAPAPAPETAPPPPPAPAGQAPAPPGSEPAPDPAPAEPQPEPEPEPEPQPQPEPEPEPDLPLPTVPLPVPVPDVPAVDPLVGELSGLVGAAPALLPGGSALAVGVRALLGRVVGRR